MNLAQRKAFRSSQAAEKNRVKMIKIKQTDKNSKRYAGAL
jgi:hypothetical protein